MTKAERKKMQEYAKKAVVDCLEKCGSASDDKILALAVDGYTLTAEEKRDKTPNSKRNTLRSLTGTVIAVFRKDGLIEEANGEYYLVKERPVIVREEECERELLAVLAKTSKTKAQLFKELEERTGTAKTATKTDDATLRSLCGCILKRWTEEGRLRLKGGKYSLADESARLFSDGESGDLKKTFLQRLHGMGGAFFERYFMNLLDCFYRASGKTIGKCQVVGGSNDGGIDGIIETTDLLGFKEIVMVQTKCRAENHVTEKEAREFYGAVCAAKGSRGIYATTATFHRGAKEFFQKTDNCIGVDGEKLFALAKRCAYGVKKTKNGYMIDDCVFN